MSEPTLMILSSSDGKRRGRPKAAEPRQAVTTWLPASDHDRLIKLANAGGMSVSELVRKLVQIRTRP